MGNKSHNLLRFLIFLLALLQTGFVMYNTLFPPDAEYASLRFTTGWFVSIAGSFVILLEGLLLTWGLKEKTDHIYVAIFLCALAFNQTMYHAWAHLNIYLFMLAFSISFWLCASTFIYSFMRFSGRYPAETYLEYFKQKRRPAWYKKFIFYFSTDRHFWLILSPLLFFSFLVFLFVTIFYNLPVFTIFINLFVLLTGLSYFRITYGLSDMLNRNKLNWMLWGLLASIAIYCVKAVVLFFFAKYLTKLDPLLNAPFYLVVTMSFVMTIFFAKATDARLVIKKTILYSLLLLTGLLVFGTIEHYLIHILSHSLHIESSVLNSILGGCVALALRPLHHKTEHWLNHFNKVLDPAVQAAG